MTDWTKIHYINESRRLGTESDHREREIDRLNEENRQLRLKIKALVETIRRLEATKEGNL